MVLRNANKAKTDATDACRVATSTMAWVAALEECRAVAWAVVCKVAAWEEVACKMVAWGVEGGVCKVVAWEVLVACR